MWVGLCLGFACRYGIGRGEAAATPTPSCGPALGLAALAHVPARRRRETRDVTSGRASRHVACASAARAAAAAAAAWRVVRVTAGVVSVSEAPRAVCVMQLKHLRTLLSPQVRNRVLLPRPGRRAFQKKKTSGGAEVYAECLLCAGGCKSASSRRRASLKTFTASRT